MLDITESLSTTPNFAGPAERSEVVKQLRVQLGDRCSMLSEELDRHAKDVSHHKPQWPDCVVFPLSNDEVAAVVRLCHDHRMPIIPFGTGTAVEGGVVAIHGGVCVDLSRMNRVLRFSPDDMDVTVQAGVTRLQLNQHLAELGCVQNRVCEFHSAPRPRVDEAMILDESACRSWHRTRSGLRLSLSFL